MTLLDATDGEAWSYKSSAVALTQYVSVRVFVLAVCCVCVCVLLRPTRMSHHKALLTVHDTHAHRHTHTHMRAHTQEHTQEHTKHTRVTHTCAHSHTHIHTLSPLYIFGHLCAAKTCMGTLHTHTHAHTHTHPPYTHTHSYTDTEVKNPHIYRMDPHAVRWHAQIIPVKHACTHCSRQIPPPGTAPAADPQCAPQHEWASVPAKKRGRIRKS